MTEIYRGEEEGESLLDQVKLLFYVNISSVLFDVHLHVYLMT